MQPCGVKPDFVMILWAIWIARNKRVFDSVDFNGPQVLKSALLMIRAHNHSREVMRARELRSRHSYQEAQVKWMRPDAGWKKCNTDGSVHGQQRLAGGGGVCRDEDGRWVFGFSRNIGSSSVLWTEL